MALVVLALTIRASWLLHVAISTAPPWGRMVLLRAGGGCRLVVCVCVCAGTPSLRAVWALMSALRPCAGPLRRATSPVLCADPVRLTLGLHRRQRTEGVEDPHEEAQAPHAEATD